MMTEDQLSSIGAYLDPQPVEGSVDHVARLLLAEVRRLQERDRIAVQALVNISRANSSIDRAMLALRDMGAIE